MSWSYNLKGPALEVAAEIKRQSERVDGSLSVASERALHARAVAMLDVACHEGKEHDVHVEAAGHFDGAHNHLFIKFDGVTVIPASDTISGVIQNPNPQVESAQEPTPASEDPKPCPFGVKSCKPTAPCARCRKVVS